MRAVTHSVPRRRLGRRPPVADQRSIHLPSIGHSRRSLQPQRQASSVKPRRAEGHQGSNAHTARRSYRGVICASGRTARPPRLLAAPDTPDTHTTSGRPSADLRRPRFLERTQCEPRPDPSAWRTLPILASPKPTSLAPVLTVRHAPVRRGLRRPSWPRTRRPSPTFLYAHR
jgi:hypothetical protein